MRYSTSFVWGLRLLASASALWAIYRYVLWPDWHVRYVVGDKVFDTYRQFWWWESPDPSDYHHGELGGIRWSRCFFCVPPVLIAFLAWRSLRVDGGARRPGPTDAARGARG